MCLSPLLPYDTNAATDPALPSAWPAIGICGRPRAEAVLFNHIARPPWQGPTGLAIQWAPVCPQPAQVLLTPYQLYSPCRHSLQGLPQPPLPYCHRATPLKSVHIFSTKLHPGLPGGTAVSHSVVWKVVVCLTIHASWMGPKRPKTR